MPFKDPAAQRSYSVRYRATHKERQKEFQRKWIDANRDHVRANLRANAYRRRYGITVQDYDKMLERQDGRCAICRTDKPCGKGRFHVDHDHKTGEVRGILCHRCNTHAWVVRAV